MYSVSVENKRIPLIQIERLIGDLLLVIIAAVLLVCLETGAAAEIESLTDQPASFEIFFEGNEAMSEAVLRKEATTELEAFAKKGYRSADIDDAAFQMQRAYREAGYAFGVVDYQIERKESGLTITFLISEGPRVVIRDIIPIGNQALEAEQLKAYFQSQQNGLFGQDDLVFVRARIASATDEIRRYYTNRGYLDATVGEPELEFSEDRRQVSLTLRIQEGVPYKIDRIEVRGEVIEGSQADLEKSAGTWSANRISDARNCCCKPASWKSAAISDILMPSSTSRIVAARKKGRSCWLQT